MSIKMKVGLLSVILVIALTALAFNRHVRVVPRVHADSDALCPHGDATLRGTYVSFSSGTFVGIGPVAAVGRATFDGSGNGVNPFTLSVDGVIVRGVLTGAYTVNSDCSATLTLSDGTGSTPTHYDMVVAPDGSEFNWIETDAGTVFSGAARRLKHSSEFTE